MRSFSLGSLVVLIAIGTIGCGGEAKRRNPDVKPHPPEALAVGKVAPDIVGEDIDGKEFKLSDYRGKVVVLDFWGNW
jgi:cytochrome oxidase Cu insertion factor (SCO1/SenC/PrrC family)